MAENDNTPSELGRRIARLEEAGAFSERTVEQLNSELAELNRRMTSTLMRLDVLERRVNRVIGNAADLAPAPETDRKVSFPPPSNDPRPIGGEDEV